MPDIGARELAAPAGACPWQRSCPNRFVEADAGLVHEQLISISATVPAGVIREIYLLTNAESPGSSEVAVGRGAMRRCRTSS